MAALRRIFRGLAGLGARRLGREMESFFGGLGDTKLPAGLCACTKWRPPAHRPIETAGGGATSVHWYKTCRGPGRMRFAIRLTEPGVRYKQVWKGKPWESGFNWEITRHAAEAEIYVYDAPNGEGDVGPTWRRRKHRHLGYFKSVAAAKRFSERAAGRACQKATKASS